MQESGLIEKLNELGKGEFPYLKLKSIEVNHGSAAGTHGGSLCVVTYIYPESMGEIPPTDRDRIREITEKLLQLKGKHEILFKKSHIDPEFVAADVFRYLSESPAIGFLLDKSDISVSLGTGGAVDIGVRFFDSVCDYALRSGLKDKLYDYLDRNYCAAFKIAFTEKQGEIKAAESGGANVYKAFGAKPVKITEVEKFIGSLVTDTPRRIADVTGPGNNITVCGTIKFINRYDIKKGKNPEGRHVFNYTVEDYSGKIKIVYFSKPDTDKRADTLITGTKIAVRGNVETDDYNGMSRIVMFAYDISLCEIPPPSEEKPIKTPPPKNYKTVFPVKVSGAEQEDFLTERKPNAFLENNVFVVFDTETTGLNASDRIIELAACKIEGGAVTEHFSTLIDPETLIPAASTKVNLITNQMVADAPRIEDAIGDFYKFCDGCAIVAHNIEFDHGYITRAGAGFGYVFDNKQFDTYAMARQCLPGLSNYSLGAVCRALGVVNETAHRALSDAAATAEVFIKLAGKMYP